MAAGGCLFAGAFLAASGKLTKERLVALLFAVGVILRIAYMLYTPASVRQQDTYSSNFNGHEAYAWTIFSTGKLPSVNDYQFYHPPLNALLQAAFMHFMQDFSGSLTSLFSLGDYFPGRFLSAKPEYIEAERYFLYQSCQILSVLYSVVTCYVGMKLLKRMGVRGWTYVGLSAFLIFFPRNFQMSGQLNNDGISYMCSMLSLYFAVKWQKEKKSFANILACAVSVGAGMMAKLTSATVCLPIAGIFVCEFVRTLQKKGGALSFPRLAGGIRRVSRRLRAARALVSGLCENPLRSALRICVFQSQPKAVYGGPFLFRTLFHRAGRGRIFRLSLVPSLRREL